MHYWRHHVCRQDSLHWRDRPASRRRRARARAPNQSRFRRSGYGGYSIGAAACISSTLERFHFDQLIGPWTHRPQIPKSRCARRNIPTQLRRGGPGRGEGEGTGGGEGGSGVQYSFIGPFPSPAGHGRLTTTTPCATIRQAAQDVHSREHERHHHRSSTTSPTPKPLQAEKQKVWTARGGGDEGEGIPYRTRARPLGVVATLLFHRGVGIASSHAARRQPPRHPRRLRRELHHQENPEDRVASSRGLRVADVLQPSPDDPHGEVAVAAVEVKPRQVEAEQPVQDARDGWSVSSYPRSDSPESGQGRPRVCPPVRSRGGRRASCLQPRGRGRIVSLAAVDRGRRRTLGPCGGSSCRGGGGSGASPGD